MPEFFAPFEYKFADAAQPGEFEGYASVFNVQDSHGDVILPGAFKDTIAERKAQGRGNVPMHAMHGFLGGDGLPIGVWKTVDEDSKGLVVQGKISGASNTDAGKLMHERVKDGAMSGLSIGWGQKKNGTVYGTKAGEPKRTIKALHLHEISLVSSPSNPASNVTSVKAFSSPDTSKAAASVAAAIVMHDKAMSGNGGDYYGSGTKNKALLMDHLRDAHEHLTGDRAPMGVEGWTKSIDRKEFEEAMQEQFGLTKEAAHAFADHAFKAGLIAEPDDDEFTQIMRRITR